jgi:hypothetical protein
MQSATKTVKIVPSLYPYNNRTSPDPGVPSRQNRSSLCGVWTDISSFLIGVVSIAQQIPVLTQQVLGAASRVTTTASSTALPFAFNPYGHPSEPNDSSFGRPVVTRPLTTRTTSGPTTTATSQFSANTRLTTPGPPKTAAGRPPTLPPSPLSFTCHLTTGQQTTGPDPTPTTGPPTTS